MQNSPFRALTHYRVLPRLSGWKYLTIAFFARSPYAMIPLGAMTAFTASTNSIATGAFATATVALSTAIAGPLIGKWADLRGQHEPLTLLTPLNAIALGTLFAAAVLQLPPAVIYPLCAFAGATCLPIGSFTRSQWINRTAMPRELAAALSYESMADELVFVLGPALVGVAASAAAPAAPLGLAFILVASVGLLFASDARHQHRQDLAAGATDAPHKQSSTATTIGGLSNRGDGVGELKRTSAPAQTRRISVASVLARVWPAVLVMTAIGMYFGATQTATTMRAQLAGHGTTAGLIYAMMGIGSAVMAIGTVMIPASISLAQRVVLGGVGMAVMMSVTALVTPLWLTGVVLTACGLFVGPTMVTAFSLTEVMAPPGGISIAMTSMQSSVTVGVSAGAALAGILAQTYFDRPTYLLTAATALIVTAVGLGLWHRQTTSSR